MIENARGRLPNWWALDFVVRQILRMVEAAGSMMCLIGLFTLFLAPTFLPYDYPWGTVIVIIAGFVIVGMTQWVIWGLPPGMRPRVPD
ncbi:hypothetical protein M1271_04660 [Patescibacteria group bacterium]|nr:hypothetical protein [Patescibacteria group bacterium]MCL5798251.1 hypothetical protein [Patescibacteria group bacterium]